MKIEICIDENSDDTKIVVTCKRFTADIEKMISAIRILDKQLTVKKDGETYQLDVEKILYIESVDRRTFVYTESDVYEADFKLYELESQLEEYGFLRINKYCVVRLKSIRSLRTDVERRIRITMMNGTQQIASRFYAEKLKAKLGI